VPRLGLISDTHGFLDPRVLDLLAGVDHILHAGDVGPPRILLELESLAPVTAVSGNTDHGLACRETEVVSVQDRKFLVHHIVNPHRLTEALARHLEAARPDVVVFGHTHEPFCQTVGGVLFVNPGSAGRARFGKPRTLAILHWDGDAGSPSVDFLELGP
jgi:hypothetical protein